jgi:hypothetical protein
MQIADLRAAIVDHPWRALAVAIVAGAGAALADSQRPAKRTSLLVTLTAALIRGLAKGEAVSWIDARTRPYASLHGQHGGSVEPPRA